MEDALHRLQQCVSRGKEALVNAIIEEAIGLTDSAMAYFATADEAKGELTMLGWSKSAMASCAMIDKPIEYPIEATGIWGDCIRERKAIITNDYAGCTRVTKKGYPLGHVQVLRHMNVPVMWGQKITGILGVGNKVQEYTEDDAALLQAFANGMWPIFGQAVKRPPQ
jgi:GAF domain-containing protein